MGDVLVLNQVNMSSAGFVATAYEMSSEMSPSWCEDLAHSASRSGHLNFAHLQYVCVFDKLQVNRGYLNALITWV